jgi:hypothetical protein
MPGPFPLHVDIWTGAAFNVVGVAPRVPNVPANYLPAVHVMYRETMGLLTCYTARFIFPAGTDVRNGSTPNLPLPAQWPVAQADADWLFCPAGPANQAWLVTLVDDYFAGTPSEYRVAFCIRVTDSATGPLLRLT